MAGMLPGVEFARRRRLPRGGSWADPPTSAAYASTRRPSLCLYTRNHNGSSSSSSGYEDGDEKLGGVAREAKERLDEKLRSQARKSDSRRSDNRETAGNTVAGRSLEGHEDDQPRRELPGLKRSMSKRFMSWAKMISWKGLEQEDCAVCLEKFMSGETLMNLPCNHRFHSRCLVPWLVTSSHCPCCRTIVPS